MTNKIIKCLCFSHLKNRISLFRDILFISYNVIIFHAYRYDTQLVFIRKISYVNRKSQLSTVNKSMKKHTDELILIHLDSLHDTSSNDFRIHSVKIWQKRKHRHSHQEFVNYLDTNDMVSQPTLNDLFSTLYSSLLMWNLGVEIIFVLYMSIWLVY